MTNTTQQEKSMISVPMATSESVLTGVYTRRPIPPKLYRIGEVVTYANVSRQTIHNYTTMGLLQESSWSPGGHRLYDEAVFGRLDQIAEQKAQKKTLQEIRDNLAQLDSRAGYVAGKTS